KSADAISAQPQSPVPGGAASDSPPSTGPLQTSPAADPEGEKQKQEWDAKWQAYKKEHKLRRLPLAGLNAIRSVRESLNQRPETCQRILIVSGDGSYTTRDVVRNLPALTTYIGRIRKDAKLHYPLEAPAGKSAAQGFQAAIPQTCFSDLHRFEYGPAGARSGLCLSLGDRMQSPR